MLDTKVVLVVTSFALLSATLCVVTYLTVLLKQDCSCCNNTPNKKDDFGGNSVTANKLKFVTRDEWIAAPPDNKIPALELPSKKVIIAHTATEGCDTQANCVFRIRFIQTFHMASRNWDDIAYNFLVGGDGAVYVGRGWDKQGVHTKGYNTGSICVAFVGNFNKNTPPQKQLNAAQMIIAEGVRLGKLSPDYKLFGHRQLIATESPGEALYKIIKTWPHWSDQVES